MLTPVFSRGQNHFIILDNNLLYKTAEKAIECGLVKQMDFIYDNTLFLGSVIEVTEDLEVITVKLDSFDLPAVTYIGLISGPIFDTIKSGGTVEGITVYDREFLYDKLYKINNVNMEDKTLGVAIGIEEETFAPYVLISFGNDTQAVSPDVARIIADDLQTAAKAAEMDSDMYQSLSLVFDEIPQERIDNWLEAYRNFREQRRKRPYQLNEEEKADSEYENNDEEITSLERDGETQSEEVGDEQADSDTLKEALAKARKPKKNK